MKASFHTSYRRELVCFTLLVFFTTALWNDGKVGGDEYVIYQFWQHWFSETAPQDFVAQLRTASYSVHHLFWTMLMAPLAAFARLLQSAWPGATGHVLAEYWISYSQSGFFALAAVLLYHTLRRSYRCTTLAALLTSGLLWMGSYTISIITGGFLESAQVLLVVLRMAWLAQAASHVGALGCCDALLVGCKAYHILFFPPLTLLALWQRTPRSAAFWASTRRYLMPFAVITGIMFGLKKWLGLSAGFYTSLLDGAGSAYAALLQWGTHLAEAWIGTSYGVLWTAPWLCYLLWHRQSRSVLRWPLICLGLVIGFLAILPFWSGANGVAGPRYLIPLLVAFAPELARTIETQLRSRRGLLVIAGSTVACMVLFYPTVHYRHNIISEDMAERYQLGGTDTWKDFLPATVPAAHPALFAWKVQLAAWLRQPIVDLPMAGYGWRPYPTDQIIPFTGSARIAYLLTQRTRLQADYAEHYAVLERLPPLLRNGIPWVAALPLWLWIGALLTAARMALQRLPLKRHAHHADQETGEENAAAVQ